MYCIPERGIHTHEYNLFDISNLINIEKGMGNQFQLLIVLIFCNNAIIIVNYEPRIVSYFVNCS